MIGTGHRSPFDFVSVSIQRAMDSCLKDSFLSNVAALRHVQEGYVTSMGNLLHQTTHVNIVNYSSVN